MEAGVEPHLETSLSRSAYLGESFYRREQAAIFGDQWFCAGRAEDWAAPGSFRVLDVAGESVIVVRGEDGALYGHINLCRHRGSQLLCGEGVLRGAIRCPYHAWAYDLDGKLIASPFVEPADVPESSKRLHPVGVDSWGGFVFVNLTPGGGHELVEQLGGAAERVKRYPLADLRVAKTLRYDVAANWKVLLENYNECYHCAGVHPELCRIVPAFKHKGGSELDWERGIPHREGAVTFTATGTTVRDPFPGLSDDEKVRHKGELIYPNVMLSLAMDHVSFYTLWPQGPGRTTVVNTFLFHPGEMAKAGFDPSDAIDFWDLVNRQDWAICEKVQLGMHSRAFRYGYYAPMEDASLDIRRYIAARLGDDAAASDAE